MGNVQPWILNNKSFVSISEEKLKYFIHDDENFIVTNFDFVYQRIKGLLENYKISPAKIERLFEKPVHKRPKQTRTKRKNP